MAFQMADDYIDVQSRIVEFRATYPEGTLQQHALDFREVAGIWWVIYTAAAYRTPDDTRPGMGTAWEPIPGKTPYTRDSELQNAETAAWGRAIVAVGAADTKRGIASAEEVRNRRESERLETARREAWAATKNKATSPEAREQLWRDRVAELGRPATTEDYQQWEKEWAA